MTMMFMLGDNWILECNTDYWRRDDPVRFKHAATQKYKLYSYDVFSNIQLWYYCRYLHSTGHTYGRPINGQREISGYPSPTQQNLWKAMVCSSVSCFMSYLSLVNFRKEYI